MKSAWYLAMAAAMLTSLVAVDARAEPRCYASLAPTSLAVRDTGLDANRVACGVSGMSLGMRGLATIDSPNFYGTLSTSLFADYQILHESGFEFSVGARIVDYRFAQSAVFTDAELALGPVSLGVLRPHQSSWWGQPVVTSHALRLEVPGTHGGGQPLTIAASPSFLLTMMPSPQLHVHGRVAGLLWSVLPGSGPDSRSALLASSDVAYAPFSYFAVTLGAEVQGGWYGLGLDHLLARAGLRAAINKDNAIELSAANAIAGAERADLVVWLGYRRFAPTKTTSKKSRLQQWAE